MGRVFRAWSFCVVGFSIMAFQREKERIDTLQSVELGEGVEIRLRMAGPFPRALALILDYLIIVGVLLVVYFLLGLGSIFFNTNVIDALIMLFAFIMAWGYFSFFECGKKGATIGKRVMGLRVVDRSGNSATRGQIFVRNILRFVDMLPGIPTAAGGLFIGGYGVGVMACFLSKRFQRLGDMVANTVVIYSSPVRHLSSVAPPVLESVAPPVVLLREEQAAIAAFRERSGLWSEARRIELADHAQQITGADGREGMTKLLGMAHWLTERD